MRLWHYILSTGFGLLSAAVLYFKLAMGHAQMFSHFAFDRAAFLGLIGIPAFVVAINMHHSSIGRAALSGATAVLMFVWFAVVSFGAGLPGNEWIDANMLNGVLILPAIGVLALIICFRMALPTVAISTVTFFIAMSFGLPAYTRHTLDQHISQTLQKGGCVLAGRKVQRKITRADQIALGWFVGPQSDQVYFVEGAQYFKWSLAKIGLDTHRGVPQAFEVTNDKNCNAFS